MECDFIIKYLLTKEITKYYDSMTTQYILYVRVIISSHATSCTLVFYNHSYSHPSPVAFFVPLNKVPSSWGIMWAKSQQSLHSNVQEKERKYNYAYAFYVDCFSFNKFHEQRESIYSPKHHQGLKLIP